MNKPNKNWLEWSVFTLSLALILGTAGVLLYEELAVERQPASPSIQVGKPETREGNFVVPVTVVNKGDATAAEVRLEVMLRLPGGASERAEFELPYLPRRATRAAWVTFLHDPAQGDLVPRVLGYQDP